MAQDSQNLPSKILIIDDDPSVSAALADQLVRYNVKVERAATLETALYLFNQARFDVVLIEIEFGPMAGLALVQKWRQHETPDRRLTAFIMLSGNKSLGTNEGLIKELGDLEVLTKPFAAVHVLPYLSRGMATKRRLTAVNEMHDRILNYLEKTGDFDKAAEQVQKRLPELGPQGYNILYDLYEKGGRFAEALGVVSGLLQKEPNNISLNNAMGRLLMRLGRFAEAKDFLKKCDELAPQNINRLTEMATAYLQLKDPVNSVKAFKQVLALTPDEPDKKFDMFSKLYDFGYDEQAIQFGKETCKPMEIVRHYNNKGVMLAKEGNADSAVEEYRRALRFFPQFKENYRIYYNIGLAAMQRKTKVAYQEAQVSLKRCLELSPEFEKGQKALETVEKLLQAQASKAS